MKHLYIVRHGQTVMNTEEKYAGQSETPLTEQGKADAEQAGVVARKLAIDYIASSPLSRAYDTAKIIAEVIGYPVDKIVLDDLLKERSYGHFEGQSWELDIESSPDVEPIEAVTERARAVLAQLKAVEADTILIVTHGTFAKIMRTVVDPTYDSSFDGPALELKNGQILKLF